MTNANNALVAQLQTISFPDSSMLEFSVITSSLEGEAASENQRENDITL